MGNPIILQQSIIFCADNKSLKNINTIKIAELKDGVEASIPDTDDFSGMECSCALNASASIAELLDYLVDGDLNHILDISTFMTDTVYFKVSEKENNFTLQKWEKHPMNLEERSHQIELTKSNIA